MLNSLENVIHNGLCCDFTFVVSIGVDELVDEELSKGFVIDATELLQVDFMFGQCLAHVDIPLFSAGLIS